MIGNILRKSPILLESSIKSVIQIFKLFWELLERISIFRIKSLLKERKKDWENLELQRRKLRDKERWDSKLLKKKKKESPNIMMMKKKDF